MDPKRRISWKELLNFDFTYIVKDEVEKFKFKSKVTN